MGYRSQVKIALKKVDYEELEGRIELTGDSDIKSLFNYANIETGEDVVVIEFDWVKWYPEYKDVQYIDNYLAELEENGKPYKIIRVGEDQGDVEIQYSLGENDDYSCDDAIYVYTDIATCL
jgi:hypothetical protein